MTTMDQAPQLLEHGVVIGSDGEQIGKIGQVYLDSISDQISWVTVRTGWFGMSESFVPMDNAIIDADQVTVPYDKLMIRNAPNGEIGLPLTVEQEDELYRYYDVDVDVDADATRHDDAGAPARFATETATGQADGYVTRSEERLAVGTEKVESGRARLRKFVATEQQTVTVPVSHDEVRMVREPVAAGLSVEDVTMGPDSIEIALYEDRVLVRKDVVGLEKITLATELVTEQRQITEEVRRERIEITGDTVDGRYAAPVVERPRSQ